jgi:MiaB-like tRNA modifying enzyme
MNQGEGQEMQHKLISLGHSITSTTEEAEAVVVNTCVVIKATELKILKRMRQIEAEGKHLVVTGCMASVQLEELKNEFPDALIVPLDDYSNFSKRVTKRYGVGTLAPVSDKQKKGIIFILPISQGCLGNCSYCITRLARGELASYPLDVLIERTREAIGHGMKEIFVTAQDTACYGKDIGSSLDELLRSICQIEGDFKVRIGMMNPDSLAKELHQLVRSYHHQKVYKFLHLPVQTGSDRLLKLMLRHYSVSDFEAQVSAFRREIPNITLSTDVITGFPGEVDADHEMTFKMLERVRPNIINVTRFSARPNTLAWGMKDQVVSRTSKDRSREIASLRFAIAADLNRKFVGQRMTALIDEMGKNSTLIARDDFYRPIVIMANGAVGDTITVEISGSTATHLIAGSH